MPLLNRAINAKQLGSTFGAISYYDLIVKGVSPSHSIIIGIDKRGVVNE